MSWVLRLKNMPITELADKKGVYFLTGPMGTGKTTIHAFITDFFIMTKPESKVIWLQLKSAEKYFRKALHPFIRKRLVTTSSLIDDVIWFDNKNNRTRKELEAWLNAEKIANFDEIARHSDRYANSNEVTRTFGGLIGFTRQKNMISLISDQGLGFPIEAKEKRNYWIITGMNDFVAKSIQKICSSTMAWWIDRFSKQLAGLARFNNENLRKNGYGVAVVTNGEEHKKFFFIRPWWYTLELSTILKYVKPSDVFASLETENVRNYSTDSAEFRCLMFAWHLLKRKMVIATQTRSKSEAINTTPENLNSEFIKVSPLFYNGARKELPNKGRGKVQEADSFCKTKDCPYCTDPAHFRDLLKKLHELRTASIAPISPELQKEIDGVVEEMMS